MPPGDPLCGPDPVHSGKEQRRKETQKPCIGPGPPSPLRGAGSALEPPSTSAYSNVFNGGKGHPHLHVQMSLTRKGQSGSLAQSWLCLQLAMHVDKPLGFCRSRTPRRREPPTSPETWSVVCGSFPSPSPLPPCRNKAKASAKCAAGPGGLAAPRSRSRQQELFSVVSADSALSRRGVSTPSACVGPVSCALYGPVSRAPAWRRPPGRPCPPVLTSLAARPPVTSLDPDSDSSLRDLVPLRNRVWASCSCAQSGRPVLSGHPL